MTSAELFDTEYTTEDSIKEISERLNEPEWLLKRRLKAYKEYQKLPYDKDTLFYKYTSFRNFDPKVLTPSWKQEASASIDDSSIILQDMDAHLIETEAGVSTKLPEELVEKGVILDSLHNLIERDEQKAKELVNLTSFSDEFDKLGCLARAFATNITIIHIPDGVRLEKPLVKVTSIGNASTATFGETISVFGKNTSGSVIDVFQRSPNKPPGEQMYVSIESTYVDENSNIKSSQIQDWNSETLHIMSRVANVDQYSQYRALTHLQGGYMSRINSNMSLIGKGSEGYDLFVQFGGNKQRFDVKSELHHIAEQTIGQTHARQVMMDKAESILRGLIVIPESGVHADSWLTSQGMTIGKGKVTAIPALKIDQNDVKAAHAASVEPLDKDLIFYLQSRGIDPDTAEEMLVKGYFEYVLKLLEDKELINISRDYLNKKWDITQE